MKVDKDALVIELPRIKNAVFSMVDEETGELKAYLPVLTPRRGKFEGGEFMLLFQNFSTMLSTSDLTGEEFKVLHYLMGKLDFENYIVIKQTEVAKEIGIQQAHISRAIKKLKELDIIREGPRAGMIKSYQLNPYFGFKGKLKSQKSAILDFGKLKSEKEKKKKKEKDSQPL